MSSPKRNPDGTTSYPFYDGRPNDGGPFDGWSTNGITTMFDRPGGSGGGGFDDTATGQVRQVSQSARMAADKLKGAGRAQQQAGSMLGNTGRGGMFGDGSTIDYKKGGKVKKSAKTSVKVRGAGKAIKGVRPAKMVSMKGS